MTYQLTHLYTLVLPVATAKGTVIVEFKGVQNMNMRGLFTTTDAQLQEALEATPEYQHNIFHHTGAAKLKQDPSESGPSVVQQSETPNSDTAPVGLSKSATSKTARKPTSPTLFE